MRRYLITIIVVLVFISTSQGQADPHFSQYYHTPLWLNPAKAGLVDGDMRVIANYRNQWSSVTVPFNTVSASYDTRIPKYFGKSCSYFGAGVFLLNDQAGDSNFRSTTGQLALSYHQSLSKRGKSTYMSLGLMIGAGQKAFDQNQLFFDNQYNGDVFDTGLSSGENFDRTSLLYLDISAGLNFSIALGDVSGVSFGLGMYHLNQPNVSFLGDEDETLYARFVFNADARIAIGNEAKLTILPTVVYMGQGRHSEFTGGVIARYKTSERFAISGGALYRTSDALIPMFKLEFNPVALAFSYDVNISDLNVASNSNGSMEVSLILTPSVFNTRQQCGAVFCPF